MSISVLRAGDFLSEGESVRLTRSTLSTKRPRRLHGHDFYEMIWVQNGRLRHHLAHGRADLAEGDILFVRPGHVHALQGLGEAAITVAVMFRPGLIDALAERHPALRGRLFWSDTPTPVRLTQGSRQLSVINEAALRLERGRADALEAEAFLLPIASRLIGAGPQFPTDTPAWLIAACEAAREPDVFREGAAGFVRVAGRAHPHVSRTARAILGQSPTDYVNSQRMSFAARRLTGSDDTLGEIAAECGLPNLSHFHKLFRQTFGQTPLRYRAAHQKDLVQPE